MNIPKSGRTSEYSELLIKRGPQRLACAVLTQAIQDHLVWHSELGSKVRAALAHVARRPNGRVASGEWPRHGVGPGSTGLHRVIRVCEGDSPGDFLRSPSVWHEVAGVDPATFARLLDDPKRLREVAQRLHNKRAPRPIKGRRAY